MTVHGYASGFINNTTSPVTSVEGGNGPPAQATTIVQDLSTIGLTSSQNPSTLGQPVTFTATVTPAGATGKVTFSFGTTLIGTALDASGKATLTTALLPSGTAQVTAIYSGDEGAAPSSSSALQQTVNALQATGLAPAVYYRTGTGPVGLTFLSPGGPVIGDFNGDGKADLAVVKTDVFGVSILLGNGDGTFQTAISSPVSSYPLGLATGDFNGDGKTDLAVTTNATSSVTILLGNGDGTFQAPVTYPAGAAPFAVVVGDFNGDGNADLAVTSTTLAGSVGLVSILLGNGDGTFQAQHSYPTGPDQPGVIALADFNGDGKVDLAITNGANVSILRGNGDGTFQAPARYPVGPAPHGVATGDFNLDGQVDLAVTNFDGSLSILLGTENGTFQAAVPYPVGNQPFEVAVGDFNGDGEPDLAVANTGNFASALSDVSVLLGTGNGTFNPAVNYPVQLGSQGIAAGEFNGDGKTDLAVENVTNNEVGVLLAIGPAAAISATAGTPQSAVVTTTYSTPLQVTVHDNSNNPVSGATVTFMAPASGPTGSFPGADQALGSVQTDINGIATAPPFTANMVAGTYVVTATVPATRSVPMPGTATFTLTNTPGPPAAISAISGGGQFAITSAAFTNPLAAQVVDSYGNLVPNVNVTFSAPASGASASFASSSAVKTNSAGIAISPKLVANNIPGNYSAGAAFQGESSGFASFPLANRLPLVITTSCQIQATIGTAVSITPGAFGGNGSYTFSVIGNLPASLVFNGATISGQITATAGTYPFSLQVTDGQQTVQQPCSVTVASPPAISISSGCPSSPMTIGVFFFESLVATTAGSGGNTWSTTGSLPNGLTLSGNSISGTPAGPPGTFNFAIQVLNGIQSANLNCSVTVVAPQLQLTSGCPGNGQQGVPYGPFPLAASGGLGSNSYAFSVQGSLPAGVGLSGSTISGTPTTPNTYNFTLSVTSGTQTVTGPSCSVTIVPPGLQISGSCPQSPVLAGSPFSLSVSATGGKPPYSFALTSGPSWMTLNGSTAAGTPGPADAGTATVAITVTDSAQSAPATFTCSLTVSRTPLQLGGVCPASSVNPGAAISVPLTAAGGLPPYSWTSGGNAGLSLASTTGAANSITGAAPATAGTYSFNVGLSDSGGSPAASLSCSLNVQLPPLAINATCPAAVLSLPLSLSIPASASGGLPPYTWSLSGASWLQLSNTTGSTTTVMSSGNPGSSGPFSFTIGLTDSANSAPAQLPCSGSITPPPVPTIAITGLTSAISLMQPATPVVQLSSPSPLPITGVVQLSFISNAFGASGIAQDPAVSFNGGGLTSPFTIAGNNKDVTAALPAVQLGTDAGTIHVEVIALAQGSTNVLATPHQSADLVIPRLVPTITQSNVTFTNETATGFDVLISGYSTPRDMQSVTLTLLPAAGAKLTGATSFTIDVSSLFTNYYSTAQSLAGGSLFTGLDIPVTVGGDKSAIGSVSVTLTNSAGSSPPIVLTR